MQTEVQFQEALKGKTKDELISIERDIHRLGHIVRKEIDLREEIKEGEDLIIEDGHT